MTNKPAIQGLGHDLIEISRIRQSIEKHGDHFVDRLFSKREQAYCRTFADPAPHFAGRFAAKEAIAKALGTGFGADLAWHDVEIINDERGKPVVHLNETVMKKFGKIHLLVSISHAQEYASAVAILEVG
jgi:holo-[acyl-carrier protein] synthase